MKEEKLNLDELKSKAEEGDPEAVKVFAELSQRRHEEELRKELFGV